MSDAALTLVVLGPTILVVVAMFLVLWRERRSARDAQVAIAAGIALAIWAVVATTLARVGWFQPSPGERVPPIGINFVVVLLVLGSCLAMSPTLRGLLTNQANLHRLHLWRLEGFLFLVLMSYGQMPALWALPAGIGDILVGATALFVARGVDTPQGRRRAIAFTLFGLADLVVAVGLGIMTSSGPTQVFQTTPTSEMATHYPLALVPAFLVPLAFTLHLISLTQLLGGTWSRPRAGAS
jgi:hypothetical protein